MKASTKSLLVGIALGVVLHMFYQQVNGRAKA